jgi:Fe-S cluster biosynthesis and repair protein YggX
MAEVASRIEQFRKMAEADPNNELGHFSLGRAYMDAGLFHEAAESFEKALSLNANLSKAYQLLAMSLLNQSMKDAAIARLTQGVKIADERGDLMPRNEMAKMLKDLGAAVPELKQAVASRPVGQGEVFCKRCGQIKPKLPKPPFSNAQGQIIFANTCADCWREWIGMGTKVINEMRLPLSDPQAQKIFDQHMLEFLNLK